MAQVLLLFLDGVGLGEDDEGTNPVVTARLPRLAGLLVGRKPLRHVAPWHGTAASLVGLDATLDTPGTPQSGTGQTALLTGENAARLFGRHFGPWIPTLLRPLLAERNLLSRARAAGADVAFANAYPIELIDSLDDPPIAEAPLGLPARTRRPGAGRPLGRSRRRRLPRAGPPLAALAAGVLDRHAHHLAAGQAVASEITNNTWRERLGHGEVPEITPEQAGHNLARIAAAHHLTLFAHYNLDYVGHRGSYADAVAALERVDDFIGGVQDALPPDVLLVVASDHGNIEEAPRGHTRNPALGLVLGPDHREVAGRLRSLTDVTPEMLRYLRV